VAGKINTHARKNVPRDCWVSVSKEHNFFSETDPVPDNSCSFEYRTMDKVQDPSNPECYTCTSSSEPLEAKTYPVNDIDINIDIADKRIVSHNRYD
jgi:hypothetical protein